MADEVKKYLDYEGLKHLVEKLTNKIEASGGGDYLPLSGGTLTGDLKVEGTTRLNAAETADLTAEAGLLVIGADGAVRLATIDALAEAMGIDIPFTFKYDYNGSNAPTIEASSTASSDDTSLFTTGGACEVTINGVTVSVAAGTSFNLGGYMTVGENTVKIRPLEGSMGSSRRSSTSSSYRKHITEIVSWGTCGWGDCTYLLCYATSLKSVPSFGRGFANVTDFSNCFAYCYGLTAIPSGLFDSCPNVTDFSYCFQDCSGLTSIPEGLFDSCPNVTDFSYCFESCSGLTSIPEGLFDSCPNVTDFSNCFAYCDGLTAIPEGLFDSCPNVTSFSSCFESCYGLTAIPEGLFDSCPNVTDFQSCFQDCDGLTAIPEGLFDSCPNVTSFQSCFQDCSGLTSIPAGLFDSCPNVTDFSYCFAYCTSIKDCESPYTTITTDGQRVFVNPVDVHLYERESYPLLFAAPTSYSRCFRDCEGLTDYDAIPDGWK